MDQRTVSYRIRLAHTEEVPRLREIEDEAGTIVSGLGPIDEALDVSFPWTSRPAWSSWDRSGGRPARGHGDRLAAGGAAYVEEMDVLPARHQATGRPSGAASGYSRKPQNQRWWLWQ
jgi:hypothetical protein